MILISIFFHHGAFPWSWSSIIKHQTFFNRNRIAMSLRKSFLADYFYRILETQRLRKILHLFGNSNQLTILGLLAATVVPFGFYVHPALGLLFIVLSGMADAVDGHVARALGTTSAFGAFLDSSFDRISDFFFLIGFWVLFWNTENLIAASFLIFLSSLFSLMVSYVKARAEALGVACEAGLMERGWRTLYLILWALLLSIIPHASVFDMVLWFGLIFFCGLTLATVIQRIGHIRSKIYRGHDHSQRG